MTKISIHRKEQDDLGGMVPLVCVHATTPGHSRRVFCLSWWGIQLGAWRWYWRTVPRHHFLIEKERQVQDAITDLTKCGAGDTP